MLALTRAVPPSIPRCELTHLDRAPIDYDAAVAQHVAYEAALASLGCRILRLPAEPELPDSVFVEDTAVVLPELAVIARPGAASRRPEVDSVVEYLAERRELAFIDAPATLDGGDVLRVGRSIWVGRSERTNRAGYDQLRRLLEPRGYRIRTVAVHGCLHLKTAVTPLPGDALLVNPAWTDTAAFEGHDLAPVDPSEPFAANVLAIGDSILVSDGHPATRARLEDRGLTLRVVDVSELAKAEGGVTCCTILVP